MDNTDVLKPDSKRRKKDSATDTDDLHTTEVEITSRCKQAVHWSIMKRTAVIMMVLSGLCFLPSCFPRLYIFVEQPSTWAEAQSYCREKYTDLASVHNERHLAQLNTLLDNNPNVWIGLQADIEAWRWSLEDPRYYGEGEADFRKWAPDEPNGVGYNKLCVMMLASGEWADAVCTMAIDLICYNGTAGTEDTSSSFIFVNGPKTWKQAQSYCREHYTDLAIVRNQAENDLLNSMTQNSFTWIGSYRDSWKWSDGSTHSFSNWAPSTDRYTCAVSHLGKWYNQDCNNKLSFVCYVVPAMKKQVVQVVLKSSVDMEDQKEYILQKFKQGLKDHNLDEDVKLRWVEQPDGKVFHKTNTDKKEGES
ncbi:C-type mannose receptor 2-like isoform X2 [Dicentrarchus labrax]|nr:C-type mannose receptor 2-like isoform X2 [Dicentrarchus labrax]XP_051245126.1 C-type mannose receptor 2-like isoform X2 [Dicentrarchus labrax]